MRARVSDLSLRTLQRACATDHHATAALWRAEERAGLRDPARTRLAARLGDPAARLLYPEEAEVDWGVWQHRRDAIAAAAVLLGPTLPAAVAADWAGRVLPAWEAAHPGDERPRLAIEAARAWVACPCDEHRAAACAARDAAAAARDAAAAAAAASDAAAAAAAASHAAAAAAASHAAYYAASAAYDAAAAAYAASAAYCAASYAAYAANTATADAASDAASSAEREWQRRRLAAYLIDADTGPCVLR